MSVDARMDIPVNRFKRRLKDRGQQIGFWMTLSSAYATEAVAGAGFDWLLVDMEHSPADIECVLSQLQAIAGYDTTAIVRPPHNDAVVIKRLLDIGAQTLLIPQVQTAEEARAAVAAIRYPPRGVRGVSATTRATRFGRIAGYPQKCETELCLIVQVETAAAVDQLESIAAVDGVDAVFFGPSDLAASMGYVGEPEHPEVKRVVLEGIHQVRGSSKAAGLLTGNHDFARECLDAGARFVAVGLDSVVLSRAADSLVARFSRK
jgi:4-hydroxy-2-oxoheptanedioate aldolase